MSAAPGVGDPDEGGIVGERGKASVRRGATVQGRLQTALVLIVLASLVGGFLYWWYAGIAARNGTGPQTPRAKGSDGEYVLPALGRVDAPWMDRLPKLPFTSDPAVAGEPTGVAATSETPAAGAVPMSERAAAAADRGGSRRTGRGGRAGTGDGTLYKSAGSGRPGNSVAPDRRLVAPVMWRRQSEGGSGFSRAVGSPGGAGSGLGVMDLDTVNGRGLADEAGAGGGGGADRGSELTQALRATGTPPARAAQLPDPAAWLPKGAFIDCTLETAIDSTLPGFASCVTALDVFGADGTRVLMARGTRLVGEVRTSTRVTQKRVFVLWHEARTPEGVIVPLSSPGTDALGRSGFAGEVDRHLMARFGAAFLVSTIDAAVQRVANPGRGSGSDMVINPRASSDIAAEILRDTIRIPPTIRVAPGSRVQVLVARNVDFRGVLGGAP